MTVDPDAAGATNMRIMETLAAENVESRPVWKPMHLQPVFEGVKYFPHDGHDISSRLFENGICLPSGSGMTGEEQEFVIDLLRRALV